MSEVIHGLTRDELVKLTFDPTERLLKALIENRGNYTISKDGVVTPKLEAVKSAVINFGNQQTDGDKPVIDWNKATAKEIAAAGRKVVESWRNPGSNQKQRGGE